VRASKEMGPLSTTLGDRGQSFSSSCGHGDVEGFAPAADPDGFFLRRSRPSQAGAARRRGASGRAAGYEAGF
jgi:hypothetical protein